MTEIENPNPRPYMLESCRQALLRGALLACCLALALPPVWAAGPYLVKDIAGATEYPVWDHIYPSEWGAAGGKVYFTAQTESYGIELWVTNGAEGGTRLVRDLYPGSLAQLPDFYYCLHNSSPALFTDLGGTALFFATDGSYGVELWRSDGTAGGTFMVKDIFPGAESSVIPSYNMTPYGAQLILWYGAVSGGIFYFRANDGVHGAELWRSDGTADGTYLVRDIKAGSIASNPSYLEALDGYVYFSAADDASASDGELWRSDGTEAGTVRVADINPGAAGSYPQKLTAIQGLLYLSADDGSNGREPWVSDGTPGGTHLLQNIKPGNASSDPDQFTGNESAVYFTADDGSLGREPWWTDGTAALVQDIRSGSPSSEPDHLTMVGDRLFFAANDGAKGLELWSSGSKGAGLVKDIKSGSGSGLAHFGSPINPKPFAALGNGLLFPAKELQETGLWRSDGTAEGTLAVLSDDIQYISWMFPFSGRVFFGAPFDLWTSDGTPAGSGTLFSTTAPPGAYPRYLLEYDGRLYFAASDQANGGELWRSDGTGGGTTLLKDLEEGEFGSDPSSLTRAGDAFYFTVDSISNQSGLWKSDGSASGTVQIAEGISDLKRLTAVGGQLFFVIGNYLWVSDGTTSGTRDVAGFAANSSVEKLTAFQDKLFFKANDGTNGPELWFSDGTAGGTRMLKDIRTGSSSTMDSTGGYVAVAGTLFFAAEDSTHGWELWKTDGTEPGTSLVKDIRPGRQSATPNYLAAAGGHLFFNANGGSGRELWRSDGTETGTMQVRDIWPGIGESNPLNLTGAGDLLFFSAVSSTFGRELWRSDGTEDGTYMVKDIWSGPEGSCPGLITPLHDGLVAFTAYTPATGVELWISDGTEAGTQFLGEINPGPAYANPGELTPIGNTLYVRANSLYGVELWAVDISPFIPIPEDLNQDGLVDHLDLALLADFIAENRSRLPCGTACGDLNGDGRIDVRDLYQVARAAAP